MRVFWSFSPTRVTSNDLVVLRSITSVQCVPHAFIAEIPGGLPTRPRHYDGVLRASNMRRDGSGREWSGKQLVAVGGGVVFRFLSGKHSL